MKKQQRLGGSSIVNERKDGRTLLGEAVVHSFEYNSEKPLPARGTASFPPLEALVIWVVGFVGMMAAFSYKVTHTMEQASSLSAIGIADTTAIAKIRNDKTFKNSLVERKLCWNPPVKRTN